MASIPTDTLASDTEIVKNYLDRAELPRALGSDEVAGYREQIKALMAQKNAKLVAHY
jgi:hypothetical protein